MENILRKTVSGCRLIIEAEDDEDADVILALSHGLFGRESNLRNEKALAVKGKVEHKCKRRNTKAAME